MKVVKFKKGKEFSGEWTLEILIFNKVVFKRTFGQKAKG